jgi:hypothetical protein
VRGLAWPDPDVDGTVHTRLGGLYWVVLIVDRGRPAGQIVDLVHLDIEGEANVVADGLEARVAEDLLEIAARASEFTHEAIGGAFQEP